MDYTEFKSLGQLSLSEFIKRHGVDLIPGPKVQQPAMLSNGCRWVVSTAIEVPEHPMILSKNDNKSSIIPLTYSMPKGKTKPVYWLQELVKNQGIAWRLSFTCIGVSGSNVWRTLNHWTA